MLTLYSALTTVSVTVLGVVRQFLSILWPGLQCVHYVVRDLCSKF